MKEKKYWLALWWWAARWYVHIWVIKYLEEKNIKIWEIVWTSMWALAWALFAMWKNSKELEKIAKEVKYTKMIDFDLKNWVLKWEKAKKVLEKYFWDIKIEELPIKLKIIAFNIETWEKKVFESGKIVDAIRASTSIPWVFKPHKIWEEHFIDWWVISNLPIDELSLENKIWVSALKVPKWALKTRKKFLWLDIHKWFFSVNYQIFYRSITYMMAQNEATSIEKAKWNKQILKFDFWNLDFLSFSEVDKFIKIWYETAKKDLKF